MVDERDVSNGEILRRLVEMGDTLKEIKGDVKAQNGRVYTLERDVAILKDLEGKVTALTMVERDIAVLKDRGDQARDNQARYVGWSGVGLAAITAIWQFFHRP